MKDKYFHFGICFVLTVIFGIIAALCGGHLGGALVAGFGTGMSAGLAKEFGDSCSSRKFDLKDLLADTIGVATGLLLLIIAYFAKG